MSKAAKASISVIVLLALIVFAVLPGVIGYTVQNRLDTLIKSLNRRGVPIKMTNYQRHWFSSSAVITLPFSPAPNYVRINHGPVIFDKGLTLALATLHGSTKIEHFNNDLNLTLGYDQSARIISQTTIDSARPFMPKTIETNVDIPQIHHINKLSATITLNNTNLKMKNSQLQQAKLNLNAVQIEKKKWRVIASLSLSGLKISAPNEKFTLTLDSVGLNKLRFYPRQIVMDVFAAKMQRNYIAGTSAYENMAKKIANAMITKDSSFNIDNLQVTSAKNADINSQGSFNMHFSWPTLPENIQKFSPILYLTHLKGHYDLTIPVLNFTDPDSGNKVNLKDFSLAANVDGFMGPGNGKIDVVHFSLIDPSAKTQFALDGLKFTTLATANSNKKSNGNFSLHLDKGCFNGFCVHNSQTKLLINNQNRPFDALQSNLDRIFSNSRKLGALQAQLKVAAEEDKPAIQSAIAAIQKQLSESNLRYYQSLINDDTNIQFQSDSTTDLGKISTQIHATWPKANRTTKIWITSPEIKGNLLVPQALIQKFAKNNMKQIDTLLANQCVNIVKGMLSVAIHYNHNSLTLNKKPLQACIFNKQDRMLSNDRSKAQRTDKAA